MPPKAKKAGANPKKEPAKAKKNGGSPAAKKEKLPAYVFFLQFHTTWSKWGKGGEKDHKVEGPFETTKEAIKAAEKRVEYAMGGLSFGCEITDDIIRVDKRDSPPDNGNLLVVEDQGDYQTHYVSLVKLPRGAPPPSFGPEDDDECHYFF